ncbi:MAG: AAA family ATPase [Spartobacteria bacterium]|nr:AAA family ATPase [Spartobacteria bacterium]
MGSNACLDVHLTHLRLTVMRQHYDRIGAEATAAQLSYDQYLQVLVDQEVSQRDLQRQRRYLHQARFPVLKELVDFDWSAIPQLNKARILTLAQGGYLHEAETILMVGHPGLGKTHLATSLGLQACRQGHRVRFFTAAGLVSDLLDAQREHRLDRHLRTMLNYRVIILDELGFLPLSPSGAHLLFQFCSTLHERVALIVTTNLRFTEWTQLFGNESLTAALLDRLTARAHIIEFIGESYRLRQRRQREQALPAPTPELVGSTPRSVDPPA